MQHVSISSSILDVSPHFLLRSAVAGACSVTLANFHPT
jgi:hypothetical protein